MSETPRFTPAQLRDKAVGYREDYDHFDNETAEMLDYAADVLEAQQQLRQALVLARQFLPPEIDRGPAVNGWQNTVNYVDEVLAGEPERTP